MNVDSTGGIGATVLKNAAAAPELIGLAGDAIGEQAGSEYAGKRMSRSSDQSFWGIGISAMFGALSEQPPAPVKMRNALGWWWHTPHDLLDKIDETNLVRDTRVFVHTLWRLLTDPVLPLDFATHAKSLLDELTALRASLGARFSMDDLIAAAESTEGQGVGRAFGCGTDARVARTGTCLLHDRRPVRSRPSAAAAGLAGARSAAQAGEDGARHGQRTVAHGQCDARAQPLGPCAAECQSRRWRPEPVASRGASAPHQVHRPLAHHHIAVLIEYLDEAADDAAIRLGLETDARRSQSPARAADRLAARVEAQRSSSMPGDGKVATFDR